MNAARHLHGTCAVMLALLCGCGPQDFNAEVALQERASTEGMVKIPGGEFGMGAAGDAQALPREFPQHAVRVDPFWMDAHEVTNAEFSQFVEATGYKTVAERPLDWEELKVQLPPGTPPLDAEDLAPGALVFDPPKAGVDLGNAGQWWSWVQGADWQHPFGPGSTLEGLEYHPVVHVCYLDAQAYTEWRGMRLPTEAEWEWAARGGLQDQLYPWGNGPFDEGPARCNTWAGEFPVDHPLRDGHYGTAPVGQFGANGFGLYDMAGNVWEICADWYDPDYYASCGAQAVALNPQGPDTWHDPFEPLDPKRVMRGGSFLCNASYCSSYRVTARMAHSQNTGMSHVGFRCVLDLDHSLN